MRVDGGVRALVIEDDPASRDLFRDVLADAQIDSVCVDHDALPAPDGFTVVVSDLPTLNGHYSTAEARAWVTDLRQRYGAPVIIVTGRSEATYDGALARDVWSVVAKPLDIDDLVARVRAARMVDA